MKPKSSIHSMLEDAALRTYEVARRHIPMRFVTFATIGALGAGLHLSILALAYRRIGVSFSSSGVLATGITMVFTYTLNNVLTFRDRRLRGMKWMKGLVSFVAVCSIGAAANVSLATYLFNEQINWLLAALSGVMAGAVWNYFASSFVTWGRY
jgi:dolichol-phosphate mannosyltransferase